MNKIVGLERQYQALASQNQLLRTKAKKINQIQTYVNILMQSSQNYQEELTKTNHQNRQLKNKIDNLMAENIRLEKTYDNEFQNLQTQFKRQLLKRQQEIRLLQACMDKNSHMFEQALNQNQSKSKNDIQRLKLEILHIQTQYESQINRITLSLNQRSKDFQISEQSKNQMKKAYLQESNKLGIEINKLQRAYHQRQNDCFTLKQQNTKLIKHLDQGNNAINQLKRQINRRQQQNLIQKKNFEKRLRMMEQNLNESLIKEKKLQSKITELTIQNEKIKKDNIRVIQQSSELRTRQKKLDRLINQKQQQIKQLILKNQQDEQQFKRIGKRHFDQLKRAEEQLGLTNERFICQKRNCDNMKAQIQDLIKVVDKLQQKLQQRDHSFQMLHKQNEVLFKQVQNLSKQLKVQTKQLSQSQENYLQAKQNFIILEQLLSKQSSKSKILETQYNEILIKLETVTKQQQMLQQEEIQNLIEKNLSEKRQMLESHRVQKDNIIRKYQLALKQKDQQAKKRLQLLEDQISLLGIRH